MGGGGCLDGWVIFEFGWFFSRLKRKEAAFFIGRFTSSLRDIYQGVIKEARAK